MRKQHVQASGAFSFVEIMIVLLILSIATAVALPMLGNDNPTRLRAAAQMLVSDLGYAQVESISHADDVRVVVFDTTNHGYQIAPRDDTSNPITNPVGGKLYSILFGVSEAAAAERVTIQSLSVGGDDILGFGVYGELDQLADATITLAAGSNSLTITPDAVSGEATIGAIN